jgi:hypothetical protein
VISFFFVFFKRKYNKPRHNLKFLVVLLLLRKFLRLEVPWERLLVEWIAGRYFIDESFYDTLPKRSTIGGQKEKENKKEKEKQQQEVLKILIE